MKYNTLRFAIINIMKEQEYKKIISGQGCRLCGCILWPLLLIASILYSTIIRIRNLFYKLGIFKIHKVNAVVISVGNITVGGTGKTPFVIWLCNLLKQQNIPIAVLTRGYKAQGRTQTDEPAEIAENYPDMPIIINPDRVAGAKEAIEKYGAKVLILDDGFQHRRLFRNLDIVTIDAIKPFGFLKLLPAGLLREPTNSLKRANAAVITHCDLIEGNELNEIEQSLGKINPNLLIINTIHKTSRIFTSEGDLLPIDYLKGKNVFAFCGIGNPDSFRKTLENEGAVVKGFEIFDDHYHYSKDDIVSIVQKAKNANAQLVITTRKDWTKIKDLESLRTIDTPFAYLEIEIKITESEDKFRRLILETVSDKI